MSVRSGKVQTVLGLIDPSELGFTQPHEHLLVNLLASAGRDAPDEQIRLETVGWLRRNWTSSPSNLRLTSEEDAVAEMKSYKAAGGGTIIDVTCADIGRNQEAIARISRATGVHVVMGSGYYLSVYHPDEIKTCSEEQIAEIIIRDIAEGVGETKARSGIIGEIGLDWPVRDSERKVLRAAALAQVNTGAVLNIHPGRNPSGPLDAIRTIVRTGGDPERTVVSHIDRTLFSLEAMLALAATGCYLEFDLFGEESSYYPLAPIDMPNDATRIDYLIRLIQAGYREKLLISMDICTKTRLPRYGGEGYSHILENVLPMMERKGRSKKDIETITVHNPARILAFL
jgi:phosphotriesterase-related protein